MTREPASSPDATPAASPSAATSVISVLRRDSNMRRLTAATLLSSTGSWFHVVAAAAEMFRLTGSSLWVGAVNFALFAGTMVLGPWAGTIADRYDRRRVLAVAQLFAGAAAVLLTVMSALGRAGEWVLLGTTFCMGISLAFFIPTLLSLVPLLVPESELEFAVSLNSVSFQFGRVIGPALGAATVAGLGATWAYGFNASAFLIFAGMLPWLRPREQLKPGTRPRVRDSLTLLRGQPRVVLLLGIAALVSIASDPIYTLTAEMAIDELGGGEAAIGILVGAFGAGATLTAFVLLGWISRQRYGLVGALLALGLGMLLFAAAPTMPTAIGAMVVAGGGFLASLTRVTTRLQLSIPDGQRGRVMSFYALMVAGSRPLSAPLDGALAGWVGPRTATAVFACVAFGTAVLVHRRILRASNAPPSADTNPSATTSEPEDRNPK